MSRVRRPLLAAVAAVVLLGLGLGISAGLTDALGIRTEPSDIPVETSAVAALAPAVVAPTFTAVDAPSGPRMSLALAELADAATGEATATLTVTAGVGDEADESYTLTGGPDAYTITAPSVTGAVRGVYDLAQAARDGRAFELGEVVSALPFRMVDLGAVGVDADPELWRDGTDYSHNSKAFESVILSEAPFIDGDALATARAQFEQYVQHALAEGYNAVAVPGLIEYLTFEGAGVYGEGDDHVARAEAMREQFGELWSYAHDLGMKVYFRTDMLTLTTPLEEYFTERFGGLDTENPEFWSVYASALDELYEAMPSIDGVLIRIGEAGRVYDLPGWDYYSELGVTTTPAVRAMLTALADQAEGAGKEVIFRSWSVGVGDVGDMHTNADSYAAVLDGIGSEALIVSTKYTLGDFYSHLPFNVTLESGDQRRIIEFQSRREFENFGAFPNDLGPLYQEAIQRFMAANPNVEGIWTWTQDGGPWRAGPMTLELEAGFWQLYELNTELAVRLARDPGLDPATVTADWARRWFSDDPATVQAIGEAMAHSRAAIVDGLYIGPYADRRVFAIGLEPPPMMWIFEWDILTGDSAVLDVIYAVSRDELDEAIDGGQRALAAVASMRDAITATDAASWKDPALRDAFLGTLAYQESTFAMLADYRAMVLRQAQWHDTGSAEAYDAWATARAAFEGSADAHVAEYTGDVDYPAFNLEAAELGMTRADRDLPMAWAARVGLALVALWLVLGMLGSRLPRVPGAAVARALWVAATRPWRAAEVVAPLSRGQRGALIAVPAVALVASRGILTWFEAPAHLLVTLVSWAVFAVVLVLAVRRLSVWPVIAVVGGAAMLRVALLLAVLTPTGPGGYWFGFWTDPVARSVYITVAFALFAWVIVAAGWAVATQIGARRAIGVVLLAVGAVLAVVGAFVGAVGAEQALTIWNDQMGLLPWGLSRILGITVYLEIPADTPWYAAAFGAVLLAIGLVLALVRRGAVR